MNDPSATSTVHVARRCRHCGAELSPTSSFCSKCGATAAVEATSDPLRDQLKLLFGNELEIERELGRGGMAAVYAAFDPALQRRVAVKVLLPEVADAGMADRFLREARTVAALQHPHVVTVYSVRSGNGTSAIVMQFVEGRSLDVVVSERGRLPVPMAALILAQAADGLQHAHERGVVHRDVKPANVLLDRGGRAVVSDFGIARRDNGPRTTETGLVVGTWAYMSPEQRSAEAVTPATDQYAFGVMAFELLTGQLPFNGNAQQMLHAHMVDDMPSMRAIRPEIPASIESVVRRMMAKEPAQRFPSLRDAERALRKLVADEGKTTLQMAAFSQVTAAIGASQVVTAITADPRAARTEQVTRRTPLNAPAVPASAPAPQTAPARSPMLMAVVGALAVLGVASLVLKGRSTPSASTSAPNNSAASSVAAAPTSSPGATSSSSAPTGAPPTPQPGAAAPVGAVVSPGPGAAAAPNTNAAVPLGTARLNTEPAAPSSPAPSEAAPKPAAKSEPPPTRSALSFALADARKVGSALVTMLNQRRSRDLAALTVMGGDAAARAELIKLTESAADFAVGYDRVPSSPEETSAGFQTECWLDVEWRGGHKVFRVRLWAVPADGNWRATGVAIDVP